MPTAACCGLVRWIGCAYYGRYPGFTMNDMAMNPKLLERKIDLINECLETINKIEPGISSMKGS